MNDLTESGVIDRLQEARSFLETRFITVPNPAGPGTTDMWFLLPEGTRSVLDCRIFDQVGNLVKTLGNENVALVPRYGKPGIWIGLWDNQGCRMNAGSYLAVASLETRKRG
ncbi:hypothetical protein LDC_0970 [sediment metagenome]|uniref:Uncharacterized protein n=1 Tax=sediment metagenome TaxID=749907 RepID=D9PHH0_9ZZZZ